VQSVRPVGSKSALHFCNCLFVALCVPTYHVCNNYVTYIVAIRFALVSTSDGWIESAGVVTTSSLAQLRDTEKQRQCRRDNARLTEGRNVRREQLLVMPMYIATELLTS